MIPAPGCGVACLPPPERLGPVRGLRAAARLLAVVALMVGAIGLAAALPVLSPAARAAGVRGWFRALLRACGVRLVVRGGELPGGGALVVANHVSWVDIPAVLAVQPARVLAKSDVRGWPVLGALAARFGTLFINRRRVRLLPVTVHQIADTLRGGHPVLVFAEGSTWCGREHGRFYPATIQAAVSAGVPVRPIRLRYLMRGEPTTLPAFLGEENLWSSMRRVLRARGLTVELTLLPPLTAPDRRSLARMATAAVLGASVDRKVELPGLHRAQEIPPAARPDLEPARVHAL